MMQIEYRIVRDVTPTGDPIFVLYRIFVTPFGGGMRELARNPNQDVLEKAIEHLTSVNGNAG